MTRLLLLTLALWSTVGASLRHGRARSPVSQRRGTTISPSLRALKREASWLKNKYEKKCTPPAFTEDKWVQKLVHSSTSKSKRGRPATSFSPNSAFMAWIDLQIGSERSTIPVLVDTGSDELAIPLKECTRCTAPRFDQTKSKTFLDTEERITSSFHDGCEIKGYVAFDTVAYQSEGGQQLTLQDHPFLAIVDDASPYLRPGPNGERPQRPGFSGILGLGIGNEDVMGIGFLENLVEQKVLDRPYFSMYFADPDSDGNERSAICFGCIDETKILTSKAADVVYYEIHDSEPGWTIMSEGFYVDNTNNPSTPSFYTVIDSGASHIYVPTDIAEPFYSQIPSAMRFDHENFTFDCDEELPLLFIGFGDEQYLIDPKYFNLGPVKEGSKRCVGAVWDKEIDDGAVVGGTFLRDKVVVFEQDKRRIGIVPAKRVS